MLKSRKRIRYVLLIILTAALFCFGTVWYFYSSAALNVAEKQYVKLGDKDNLETLTVKLEKEAGLKHPAVFKIVAKKMNLERWMKRGRYTVSSGMSIIELVRVFRSGRQMTVDLVIKPNGSLISFAEKCGEKLEPDPSDFLYMLNDSIFLDSIGFNRQTVYALLLPDTYNLFWHTQADELFFKLSSEYRKFWDTQKRNLAESHCGLSPIEVATLASIVAKETNKVDEMPMVAGLYLNRLKKGMALQADPTVIFAMKDASIKRVRLGNLKVESPYNTYLNKGLPPGPICIPSKQAINAVLNYTMHDYLFMCAKEDFSGYHNFAIDFTEHKLNAKRYQAALDLRNIQ